MKILVVYYSVKGTTEALARAIGRGIEMTSGCEAVLRAAPPVAAQLVLAGIPYTEPELRKTLSGGSPYGASHVERASENGLTGEEKTLAEALGRRLASLAQALAP